ncbi:ZP domain-containing protein-like [Lytechinus variegatus]|uniref:ZP domain-containing protein-like n=1 Tax=Lytechinus variegatus TaxID=7654 RepID=UPI001BB21EFB|nr:ZP domain-containing protein-like [Lytechinus variegatus]
MYIETTSRTRGEEARLWSPTYPVAGGHCVEFYYHMYGSTIETLNVYIVETGEDALQLLPSWSQSSNQGNQWYIDRFLAPTVNDYRVVFEGVAGSSYTSDIAIDDVRITSGSCLSQGDCDFEEDYCTWINDVTVDDFDWIRKQGTINGTGPPTDHTFGSSLGYYVYLDQTNQTLGRTARMISSHFNALTGTRGCVSFWYYLEGNDAGALTVAQARSGFPYDDTAWMLDSTQGASWNYGQVSVARDYDYRIVFIGEVGASTQGIIAVDDILVTDNNSCSAIPNSAIPQPTLRPPPPQTTAPDTVTSATTRHITPAGTTIAPGATVSCGSMSMTAILDRTLLENNGDARDVHFEDQGCTGYDYSGSQIAVTTRYDECNTQSEQTDAVIKYSNVVTYFKPTSENGSQITRDFRLKIPVICELNRRSLLGNDFKPKVGIVSFTEVGYGSFSLILGRYTDEHFTTPPPDLDALVHLGQKLYFGVKLNASTDLTLLIDRCWATPDVYPTNPIKYTFIKDGCGLDSTVGFHEEDASLKGFSIDAFTFIGEYHEVFLHCDIFVCEDNDPSSRCSQGCVSRARRAAGEARGSSSQPHTISNGPMSSQHARSMDTSWLANPVNMMLVAAAGFFITMVAMVTVRELRSRGKPSKGYNRLEAEGENEA